MVSINDVLKASKGLPVDDIFAQLWGRKLSGDYTITTYTGTLPATLTGTKAGYLHRYKIYGNLTQNGTPTPENPIYPSECGERTENWFDADSTHQGYYNNSGNFVANNKYICSQSIIVNEQNYTISAVNSYTGGGYIFQLVYFDANDEYISLDSASLYGAGKKSLMGSVPSSATKMIAVVTSDSSERMLNTGSTALPYEPYGYKLPLLSGSTPVDIYLGESQTTRRIKKLVLTGDETWSKSSQAFYSDVIDSSAKRSSECVCSHFPYSTTNGICITLPSKMLKVFQAALPSGVTTPNEFKAYLAQQYAAGTPVTIWYILATEETGTLNEPLRKIGNYADTIDNTQTTARIPTTANSTTISWGGSGLAPSEVEFEYERA